MRGMYFRDPASNNYIAIPYGDRTGPPVSRWEIQAAEKRASFAQLEGDKIRSERVYFDRQNLFEQLGLKPK